MVLSFLKLKPFDGTPDIKNFYSEITSNGIIDNITVAYRFNLKKK